MDDITARCMISYSQQQCSHRWRNFLILKKYCCMKNQGLTESLKTLRSAILKQAQKIPTAEPWPEKPDSASAAGASPLRRVRGVLPPENFEE